ncbi:MAG TPA: FhaA domain-containing protein [Candidatus Baltobacteraceae bacterium]|jgi:hypothetical protein
MSWFARIEESCAAFIERSFAKTFPSDLEPAQIARKLVATMEAKTRGTDAGLVAPDRYTVFVNPDDYERLVPHREYLEREWADLLDDMAGQVNVAFNNGAAAVALMERSSVPKGAIEIDHEVHEPTERLDVPRRAPSTGRFQLRMVRGVPAYGVYPIEGPVNIGRSDESDVFLVDPSVSRRHAVIDVDAGWPIVHDLESTNGTFVNGERIETRRLSEGDLVAFGKTELRLEVAGA